MKDLDSNQIAEFRNHFTPKTIIVKTLPDAKEIPDTTKAYKKNTDGTYNKYEMIDGNWILTGSNLTTE